MKGWLTMKNSLVRLHDRLFFLLAHNTWPWLVGFLLIGVTVSVLFSAASAFIIFALRNYVLVDIFSLPVIAYWQAVLIFLGLFVVTGLFRKR